MDYTKKENRVKALDKINADCLKAFIAYGIELSKDVIVDVKDSDVQISYKEQDSRDAYFGRSAFASEIRIQSNHHSFSKRLEANSISVGSCGSFNPEYKGAYWRAIHAAEILKNWRFACNIVNAFCKKYRELEEEINQQNK